MPNPKKGKPVVPVDQLVELLDEFGDGFLDTEAGAAFGRLMNVLEAKAVEVTPEVSGNLASSTVVRVERRGDMFVGSLRFATEYASWVHELMFAGQGPESVAKPGNEFGKAGPKFLERPLRGFTKELTEDMTEALRKYWGGKARGGRRGRKR